MTDYLTEAQRQAIAAATSDGHRWRVSTRAAGWRGLTTLGLAYGRRDAARMPGALGLLTPAGERAREQMIAAADAARLAAEAEGDAGPYEVSDLCRLRDARWRLENAYTGDRFRDGAVRDRIAEIDRAIAQEDQR